METSEEGKFYMKQTGLPLSNYKFRFNGAILRPFLLPDTSSRTMDISLAYKAENLSCGYLKVRCYDNTETLIRTDSATMNLQENRVALRLSIRNTKFVVVIIEAEGTENVKELQALYLDSMDIMLDNKKYNAIENSDIKVSINRKEIISARLGENLAFRNIKALGEKRIIAVGETVHGCSNFGKTFSEIMKHMVLNNNCKLVGFELSPDFLLKWNIFISEETDFTFDDLVIEMEGVSLSPALFFDMLLWLKEYNQSAEKKVRIFGMEPSAGTNRFSLPDYTHFYKQKSRDAIFDTLSTNILREEYEKSLSLAENNPNIRHAVGDIEWQFLKHTLSKLNMAVVKKGTTFYFKSPFSQLLERDGRMFENVSRAISLYLGEDEKALIWTHNAHATQSNLYLYPDHPLGYYLRQHYGNEYYNVGLLTGEGSFTAVSPKQSSGQLTICQLPLPEKGSVEHVCMLTGYDYFFCPVEALSKYALYLRYSGKAESTNQFYYRYLPKHMDAFIFEKRSEGFEIPDIWKNRDELIVTKNERYYKLLERNNFPRKRPK